MFSPVTGTSRRYSPIRPLKRMFRVIARRLESSSTIVFSLFGFVRNDEGKKSLSLTAADNRQHPRVPLVDTTVYVTDGCFAVTARIDNISPQGICLRNLPEQIYRNATQLTVFSSDNPCIPILHIAPRWQNINWSGKTMGAAILNGSYTWRLFFVDAAEQLKS